MEPAIMAGDYILVNKQIPGPRVYRDINNIRINGKVQTKRFRGIRKVRRNDILVFNFPFSTGGQIDMNLNVNYVKRCVAIPGDTFYIENGIYKVKNAPSKILGNPSIQQKLSKMRRENFDESVWNCFPWDTIHYPWNIKDFGPLYIPKKGDIIAIDTVNYLLYNKLITYETDEPIYVKDGNVFAGDSIIVRYSFKMNYYFMAGDVVSDSKDSRYWGLLPEDHIIGKAIVVWKSRDMSSGKINWKRIFKIVK
jgi:signal peptidase I